MRDWLKKIRENAGYTQGGIAADAKISKSYYEKIESGDRGVPVDTAKKIASVLGFDWQLFYEDNGCAVDDLLRKEV